MWSHVLALVVPPACVVCRASLPRAELRLCAPCAQALPWLPAGACRRCGLPSHGRRACPAAGAAFGRAWAPLAHEGVARDLVGALKFRAALPVAHVMAAHLAANLPGDLRGMLGPPAALATPPAALVPVPAHAGRRRRRGFDPAGLLCAALARRLAVEPRACLRRRDRAGRQVGATRAERRGGDRLEIALRGPPPRRAVLVDDVHTTGATLDACARALLGGGCEQVVAVTYTRTL